MHPQTGTIQKTQGTRSTMISWMGRMHTSFHLGKKGEWLLGFFGGIFVISLLTGLILYRKNIGAVLLFRKRVMRKASLHQLVGVYALLFNVMLGISGFWMQRYVFKKSFYKNNSYIPVLKASPPLSFSLEKSLDGIQHAHPDFTAYVIYFSQNPSWNTSIYGSRSGNSFIHSKKYADIIYIDSAGRIAGTAFVRDIRSSDRYDIINSQLHAGKFGGFAVKLIYGLFGITGALLSITGFLLWVKRRRTEKHPG
jgi:uncharacterized iron-regulated membrane protein